MAILWIRGDASTALQTRQGGLQEPWWGSATDRTKEGSTVKVLYQGWNPGEMYKIHMEARDTVNEGPTDKEVYQTEDGSAAKVMYQGWDPGEIHKVKEGPTEEEQTHARVVQDMVEQSAFFGWCTDVRGTNAGVGTMELIVYGSHEFMSPSNHCFRQQQAGQNININIYAVHTCCKLAIRLKEGMVMRTSTTILV
jgi:hypothetical protein